MWNYHGRELPDEKMIDSESPLDFTCTMITVSLPRVYTYETHDCYIDTNLFQLFSFFFNCILNFLLAVVYRL